jgi:hypothetical protein
MKFVQLNEQKLLEKTPVPPGVVSPEVLGFLEEGDYQKAFEAVAGSVGGGEEGSPQNVVLNKYMEDMFPGVELDKIKDFRDYLEKLVIETGFNNNPVIIFLQGFLKNSSLSRKGFITLNNLYANDNIESVDFLSSDITSLLKSDLFEKGTDNAATIIDLYKQLLYSYDDLNIEEMEALQGEQVPFLKLNWDDRGGLKDKQSKQNLADMVIFRPGLINKQVDTVENIKNKILKLRTRNVRTGRETSDAENRGPVKVVGRVATELDDSQRDKFDNMFKGVSSRDVPAMMRYLKDKKLVG